MRIIADVNQTTGSHKQSNSFNHRKLQYLGHRVFVYPLPYGDYIEMTAPIMVKLQAIKALGRNVQKQHFVGMVKVAVDRKNSISEACGNICSNTHEHERFRNECIKAQQDGAKFYVLIEDDTCKTVQDVFKWNNPRRIVWMRTKGDKPKQPPANGSQLAKAMITMEKKYGVKFVFCRPKKAAETIVKLLEGGTDGE